MKFSILLLAAMQLFACFSLQAQIQYAGDVLDEVTEVTASEMYSTKTNQQSTVSLLKAGDDNQSEEELKVWSGEQNVTNHPQSETRSASAETTNFPGPEANVPALNETDGESGLRALKPADFIEIAKANRVPLTPKQMKAIERLKKAEARAAAKLSKIDAKKAAALVPRNSAFNSTKRSLYGQFGISDQRLDGLNQVLANDFYPTAGSYSYRTELGMIQGLSGKNRLNVGLRYGMMNGFAKNQRIDFPSVGQATESTSNMWLIGLQTGLDHDLLSDSDWSVSVGLGLGADLGGLRLTERIEEVVTTLPSDPSIPTPEEVALVHYNVVNIGVTPRITLRSPQAKNGSHFEAQVGYQFGTNTLFRVNELTSLRDRQLYDPTGFTASVGFVVPFSSVLKKQ